VIGNSIRIGHGYDIHRFESASTSGHLTLGGVKIPHNKIIVAHSDGDLVIHAIIDALLGALALGDIGQYFPDTDKSLRGADSRVFLRSTVKKVHEQGYKIGNIDVSIIAEAPQMAPFLLPMREILAQDLQVSVTDINIKATTHEKLDAIGNQLGIAAHAVALLIKL